MIQKMEEASKDTSIPLRVRNMLKKVLVELKGNDTGDTAVKITSAIYELDEILDDVNIPMHAKTALWDIVSDLETIRDG